MRKVISEFSFNGKHYEIIYDNQIPGTYHVHCDEVLIQPSHNAEGIIRYLSHMLEDGGSFK